jgi:5-formyltetrahydrofolate cyclo-ligase
MTDMSIDKMALRRELRAKRHALPAYRQHLASAALSQRIISHISRLKRAKKVAFYLAKDGEIDLSPLIYHCLQQDIYCFLPVLRVDKESVLGFAEWLPGDAMKCNRFGIAEPVVSSHHLLTASELDIIFMPVVAFDNSGNRLGMGGGYYDRSLADCCNKNGNDRSAHRPYLVAVAHDLQYVPALQHEPWDILPDMTITPTRVIKSNIKGRA